MIDKNHVDNVSASRLMMLSAHPPFSGRLLLAALSKILKMALHCDKRCLLACRGCLDGAPAALHLSSDSATGFTYTFYEVFLRTHCIPKLMLSLSLAINH